MKVPFCDLTRVSRLVGLHAASDILQCVTDADFVGGERVSKLQAQLCEALDVPHTVACANGTDAIVLGLMALGVRRGDVVALPALTFWASFEAVVAIGAKPLLLDVADDLQLGLDELRRAHDAHRFGACIMVHLFGWASTELAAIRAFCRERDIKLLEDGAQCFGVELDGKPVLSGATIGTLSFYPAKVLGGAGDGGAVTCSTAEQAALVRSLANHGRTAGYRHERVGINSRMGAMQAAYLSHAVKLSRDIIANRHATMRGYHNGIQLGRGLKLHAAPPDRVRHNGYLAVVTSANRTGEELAVALHERGIGHARTYPSTVADQVGAKGATVFGDLPVSREFCRRVVNLPLFFGQTQDETVLAINALLDAA